MTAEIVTLQKSNFRDPVATLREIANEIESGKYGEVSVVGIAMRVSINPEGVEIFALGQDSEPANIGMLFARAHQEMVNIF